MKRFLPLLILTGLLFGQDTLRTVSGQVVIGKLMEQEEEYVFFKPDGAQQSQKIPIRLIKEIRLGNGKIIDFGKDVLPGDYVLELDEGEKGKANQPVTFADNDIAKKEKVARVVI